MIEVNLFSIPANDHEATVGRLVARSRFDRDTMGVSVMEFVKGFLKNNLDAFEDGLGNADITGFINSDVLMSTVDLASLEYYLGQAGYKIKIWNVADDEENAVTIPVDVVEWNIENKNFVQNDYGTVTKIIPSDGKDIPAILRQVVEQSGLFSEAKFGGAVNPFTILLNNLDHIKQLTGRVESGIVTKIYQMLHECHFHIFVATSED